MRDPNLDFLNKFIELYEELLAHDGYGDMQVNFRMVQGRSKEVRLFCGREYRYLVGPASQHKGRRRYKVVENRSARRSKTGLGRRSEGDRRQGVERRQHAGPRNFRLERRTRNNRRTGPDRRK